jgi:hypothetical protein
MLDTRVATPFTETEYNSFIQHIIDPWEPSHRLGKQHDIVIDHPEGRQIRIDSAHHRISYRYRPDDHWGLREKKVSDLHGATEKLMTVAMFIDMTEIRYLGLDGHPERPEEISI